MGSWTLASVRAALLSACLGCSHHQLEAPTTQGPKAVIPITREQLSAALGDGALEACPANSACVFTPADGLTLWVREDGSALLMLDRTELHVPVWRRSWLVQGDAKATVPIPWPDATHAATLPAWDDVSPPAGAGGRPVLGVLVNQAPRLGLPVERAPDGAIVASSWWGWQAGATAGVQPSDRLVSIDGTRITSGDDIEAALARSTAPEVSLVISRDNQEQTLTLRPPRSRLACQKRWAEGAVDGYLETPDPNGIWVQCPPEAVDFLPDGA